MYTLWDPILLTGHFDIENHEYVRNNVFVYSHKTQLCAIKYVYYTYYNDMFRPSTAIIRLYEVCPKSNASDLK